MYVKDVGIVYWASVQDSSYLAGGQQETLAVADMMLIDTVTIPGTGFRRRDNDRSTDGSLESSIGEVKGHIVLAEFIVFVTHLNKVFCYPTIFPVPALDIPQPIELTTFYPDVPSEQFSIRDLQGSFTRFAIFTDTGSVLMGSQGLLQAYRHVHSVQTHEAAPPLPHPIRISSSQPSSIVSMAFGDHHFHTLKSNGTIVSYGKELQGCGALGLSNNSTATLRGVAKFGRMGDAFLPEREGRTVWFEPLMENWLQNMKAKYKESEVRQQEALQTDNRASARKAIADYFEQKGAEWEKGVAKNDEMGAYFVLKVAAAGWHSAALVLIDDEVAEKARNAHKISRQPAPSPAPSVRSVDSREVVEAPWDQLSNTVCAIGAWFWEQGRRFLGLTQRDERREMGEDQAETKVEETEYTWEKEPFPRLRVENGTVVIDEA